MNKKESLCNRRKSASFLPGNPRNKGNKGGSSESQMQVQKNLSCKFNSYFNIWTGKQGLFILNSFLHFFKCRKPDYKKGGKHYIGVF